MNGYSESTPCTIKQLSFCVFCGMEEPRNRYILLQDGKGKIMEKTAPILDLASKLKHLLVSKGELLEALPENEQPGDTTRIALGGIDPKLRLECSKEDATELTVQEADLLVAVSSPTLTLEIFRDGRRLDFGKRLELESRVLVPVRGISNKLPGVVRFKGKLPDSPGTMFGVELHQNPGLGTCDGTFGNKQYFKCAPNSAVFVGLDELEPLEDNRKSDPNLTQPRNIDRLQKIQQEKDKIVKEKDKCQVHKPALEDIEQLKNENSRLKLEKDELVVQNKRLQTDLRAKEAEVRRLETSLATAQRALEECQQIKEPCDWVVSRDEVQITDKSLGVGGWGEVVLGTFRGSKVAVKQIHELIFSPYNRRLFEREMNIASRCRHPCLLQFVGATNDEGSPLFITELMETSLRALLERRQLADTEISIISLDVSQALNYLHNIKPSPIAHRDVSSAKVLLWQQGNQWRGKLSDYGTANFVQPTMTRSPGAAIYSAPESFSPYQTCKVDVYSFGVLLCEMCICEMPDPDKRNEQVLLVRNDVFRDLVDKCLKADPAERPDMATIIQELEGCDQTH